MATQRLTLVSDSAGNLGERGVDDIRRCLREPSVLGERSDAFSRVATCVGMTRLDNRVARLPFVLVRENVIVGEHADLATLAERHEGAERACRDSVVADRKPDS